MSERDIAKSSKVFSKILAHSINSSEGWFTVADIETDIDVSQYTVERRLRDLDELGHLDARTRAVGGRGDNPTEYRLQL